MPTCRDTDSRRCVTRSVEVCCDHFRHHGDKRPNGFGIRWQFAP